ncbi:MAG: hypothetical protein ACLT99_08445 [Faecalibacterium prausnitzii]
MKKNNTFRRAAALVAALSITVSLAAPAFAGTYYIDDGDITIIKNENGSQTIKQQGKEDCTDQVGDETIITTHKKAITTLESDLEGPAAEDSGFGPVVEDNYQPAPPAQPEDAEEPKDADQPEDDDQKNAEESENDEEQKDADRQENTDRKESAEEPEDADRKESADRQAQPQQAAPAAAPAASTPGNGFCKNIITVINNAATALKLTLKDVKIDVSDTGTEDYFKAGKAALSVQGSGDVEIELDGKNELKSGFSKAGLEKTSAGTLTLKDDNQKAGSLTATGGNWAAGIGGGYLGNGKNITIKGGTVNAAGGDNGGAGIGGGDYGSGEDITITGGTVNAAGGLDGAGIGGGWKGSGKNITITGGTVNAAGGNGGSGIGGGDYGSGEDITIKGGTVNAAGGYGGAGIGGGYEGSGSNVTVSGAAQVTAITGKPDWVGAGATIGSGGNETGGQPVDGEEIQADIRGVTTGYIHHIIYEQDGTTIKKEWREPERPQPNPEDPNAPAEESNEVDLGTPGLHVETLEGDLLPFDARQQGGTLRVTSDTLSARLHGTRQALEALREQGVEQIQFVTTLKTTTLSVEDLLAEGGSWFALEHDGLGSRRLSAAQAESLKCRMR